MVKHLVFEDRVKIELWLQQRVKFSEIASRLGFSRATITQEIQRSLPDHWPNTFKAVRYRAQEAQYLADQRQHNRPRYHKRTPRRLAIIKQRILEDKWSPEQIVFGTRQFGVSVAVVYNWINYNKVPGITNKDLRFKGKRYKRAMNKRIRDSYHQQKSDKREAVRLH